MSDDDEDCKNSFLVFFSFESSKQDLPKSGNTYYTECGTDLDYWSEMIIFESILKQAPFFEAAEAVVEISSSLQITNCNQVKLALIL